MVVTVSDAMTPVVVRPLEVVVVEVSALPVVISDVDEVSAVVKRD